MISDVVKQHKKAALKFFCSMIIYVDSDSNISNIVVLASLCKKIVTSFIVHHVLTFCYPFRRMCGFVHENRTERDRRSLQLLTACCGSPAFV